MEKGSKRKGEILTRGRAGKHWKYRLCEESEKVQGRITDGNGRRWRREK